MVAPDAIVVVSTWSDKDARRYGQRFLDGFEEHWSGPHRVDMVIHDEDAILEDPAVRAFREREADDETLRETDMHRGAMKWSWKVFALTMEPLPASGWMIWIDGDVEFVKTPTQEFFDAVCPDDADVSFLGRPWAYASETGFVAYRMGCPAVQDLLRAMRDTYLGGSFRKLRTPTSGKFPEWGDAAVFDHCRNWLPDLRENNLAAHLPGPGLHVWPETVLGEFMLHHKGVKRKKMAYGA